MGWRGCQVGWGGFWLIGEDVRLDWKDAWFVAKDVGLVGEDVG